jgi:hypothetical protein
MERISIASGWHSWYELKVDPDAPQNLIICGSKWDAESNASLGFVYASSDGGATWRSVLEDRNSAWVTEQSCAFGSHHKAYFISEASKVIDGRQNHDLGATRLYVSEDGGQHWSERLKTGWADWSTSAANTQSRELYTFYNSPNTAEAGRGWGTNVGLLVFSTDGKTVQGPFFQPNMQERGYRGVYPSYAIALKSGAVVALYHGLLGFPWQQEDLGFVRAGPPPERRMENGLIVRRDMGIGCSLIDKGALAYDAERDRLFLIYGDGCKRRKLFLSRSDDEGRTWTQGAPIVRSDQSDAGIVDPSLAVLSGGRLGLMWKTAQSSGRWYFSVIQDQKLSDGRIELSSSGDDLVSNDTLSLNIFAANSRHGGNPNTLSESSITMNVASQLNNVLRSSGLAVGNGKIQAIWSSGDKDGMHLFFGVLSHERASAQAQGKEGQEFRDVTSNTSVLYAGKQHFDATTKTLTVCVSVANRGSEPLQTPLALEVRDIHSPLGSVSIQNASNGKTGPGAVWDLSGAITGTEIPPRSRSNPCCLVFHFDFPDHRKPDEIGSLLTLKLGVLTRKQ